MYCVIPGMLLSQLPGERRQGNLPQKLESIMRAFLSLSSLVLAFFAQTAFALMSVGPPLKVETGVPAWDLEYGQKVEKMTAAKSYPADGYTECRETEEIRSAYLCISNTQKGMNSSLGRASAFIEGVGGPRGELVKQTDPTYVSYKTRIGGHDLRGADLLRFNDAVVEACAKSKDDPAYCYNAYEKDIFENFILPRAKKDPNFVVITFGHTSNMDWREVVTHEILHAQYFIDPKFRAIADQFWNDALEDEDRAEVRDALSAYYDPEDELLMRNEFQAYMLMAGAENNLLREFVSRYRKPLFVDLAKAGIKPVQVQEER
jgi:hypothetical protein